MARIFLLNPPSPEPVRTPLLSLGYLAASLQAAGHAVAVLDASAVHAPKTVAAIAQEVQRFAPDLLGLHLKTHGIRETYQRVAELARALPGLPLLAGGPHATVLPNEPLLQGFRFLLRGEAEHSLVELAAAVDGRRALSSIAGLSWRSGEGSLHHNEDREFIQDLDALASPLAALPLFDASWYGSQAIGFGGILSSRGCPAACTFCCNNVTGRSFRYRSASAVAVEAAELGQRFGVSAFSFLDDSFAVGRRRVAELCEALGGVGGLSWTATVHPGHLDPGVLSDLQRGGCGGIDIGMESADAQRLRIIGKGVTVDRVRKVLCWCQDIGMRVTVNLMFGWPDETEDEITRALDFMKEAHALGATFNARGVAVPYPGTELYAAHAERLGLHDWWLDKTLDYMPFAQTWDEAAMHRAYASDAALERNFFGHSALHRERIAAALSLKATLTFDQMWRSNPHLR